MKLVVNLLKVLFCIFIFGVGFLLAPCKESVFSKLATGLVTGSFVAIVNAYLSYRHQRKSYFEDLKTFLVHVEKALFDDYIETRNFILYFVPDSNDFLKKNLYGLFRTKSQDYYTKKARYQNFYERIISRDFSELVKTDITENLAEFRDELKEEFEKDILNIPDFDMFHSYTTLPWEDSSSGGTIPDEFIDVFRSNCENYRRRIAYGVLSFSITCSSALELLKNEIPSSEYDGFVSYIALIRNLIEKEGLFIDNHGFQFTFDEVLN